MKSTDGKTLIKLNIIIPALKLWELTLKFFPPEKQKPNDAGNSRSLIDTCQLLIEEDA